jgi:uncharacterized membrane protein YfcA
LIPALMLVFGANIKTAGSASIVISLGIVLTGLWRYWRADAVPMWQGRVASLPRWQQAR